ncbi:COG4223 family protein [Neogemmobacter tilapiae]|uniref:Mitochondrial inner membrane protein n=1 Tax=Neogemmobacter tilapiae TaxID=875041 RepID=A0A918WH96_9RHOB|nr:hypothetical protein [Gemmobacter tilapiae]GHC51447.1 hypothetical protein GCM10007315_12310 [Gemmobacter tilapiae]
MTDTTDIPDPAPEAVPTPPKPDRPRSAFPGLVTGGALAAAMGFGLSMYLLPQGWQPVATDTALIDRLTAVEMALAAIPKPDTSLTDRLAAVEAALAKPAADLPDLTPRLDKIESELAALKARPVSVGQADSAEAVARVEAAAKEAEAQLAATKAEAEATARAARITTGLARLTATMESGQPYAEALAVLTAEGVTAPEGITQQADSGLPSLAQLQADFPAAARAALTAALRAEPGEGWTDRFGTFLRSQTGARSLTPQEGSDPDAILSRAEAALAKGDLAATLSELAALSPEAAAEMTAWVEQATKRQTALAAVAGWQP